MDTQVGQKKRITRRKRIERLLFSPLYFVLTFIYIEIVFHVTEFHNASVLFPVLFAIPAGILFGLICDLFPEKIARILRYALSALVMVVFNVQIVYFHSFQSFMSMSQVGMGGDVFTNFFKIILLAIWECMIPILLIFLPLAALYFLHRRFAPDNEFDWKRSLLSAGAVILTQLLVVLLLPVAGKGDHSAYANYHDNWVLDLSMEKLGMLTTTGYDLKYLIVGNDPLMGDEPDVPIHVVIPGQDTTSAPDTAPTTSPSNETSVTDGETTEPAETTSPYNVIEGLDFGAMAETESDGTVKKILEYLDALSPTAKNQYTGMFEGYNLILITAESFSPMGIHPELTPTLYMLANSGFDFTNYWTMYPSNTTNGEYSHLTGLIPDISKPKTDGSFVFSVKNTMNMNIANFFNAQGSVSRAYHNHTGSYYKRNITHPNLGYLFKGKEEIGGLSGWPESDLVMMQKTIGDYINEDVFHAYYMTVSGHHNYKFGGLNSIADKNKELVAGLDMSDAAKAYLATHIELDRALEYLISELDKAGKLEKTVICISTDHYPYGLSDKEYKEMLGHSIKYDGMERYASDLIIWNSEMETVQVDKPCCTVDVLPTLLNLFGFEYDSRLYSGSDILSSSYGLAMTTNQSFITDKIVYNSRYETIYYLDKSWEMPEGYLEAYIQVVKNRFAIASNILNYDFYAKLPADVVEAAQKGS